MVSYTKCQRTFTQVEIETIKQRVADYYAEGRCRISREVCRTLNWYAENGKPKEWICRELLLTLEKDGVVALPPPVAKSFNRFKKKRIVSFLEPAEAFTGTLKDHRLPKIKRTSTGEENDLWDHLVGTYHYLGYKGHIGRFLKYVAWIDGVPVACLGWMGAALKVQSRDRYCGITEENRYEAIKHLANNFRFVILPWVKIKYLASHLLSKNVHQVRRDWKDVYNIELTLLETFIEKERFTGTCYKAANWECIGETKGYAKTKHSYKKHRVMKAVYVYDLKRGKETAHGIL